jgi:hypothetical protein
MASDTCFAVGSGRLGGYGTSSGLRYASDAFAAVPMVIVGIGYSAAGSDALTVMGNCQSVKVPAQTPVAASKKPNTPRRRRLHR